MRMGLRRILFIRSHAHEILSYSHNNTHGKTEKEQNLYPWQENKNKFM